MGLCEAALQRRRAAWDALSFPFLDTEVRDALPSAAVALIRCFPMLRVRGLDPAESVGRARVEALLAARGMIPG